MVTSQTPPTTNQISHPQPALESLRGTVPAAQRAIKRRLFLFFFFLKKNLFIYLFLAALGLRCCARAFSSCGERGPLFVEVRGFLIAAVSLVAEHGLQSAGSVIVAHGLSCSAAYGIFPDQGLNPCPQHQQADSQPLRHQGSPRSRLFLICGVTPPCELWWGTCCQNSSAWFPLYKSTPPSASVLQRNSRKINIRNSVSFQTQSDIFSYTE